jgi:hypothetical protein
MRLIPMHGVTPRRVVLVEMIERRAVRVPDIPPAREGADREVLLLAMKVDFLAGGKGFERQDRMIVLELRILGRPQNKGLPR